MTEFISKLALALIPALVAVSGAILLQQRSRRIKMKDGFSEAIQRSKSELREHGGQVDEALISWHFHSVRMLESHAHYFMVYHRKWWLAKADSAWSDYKQACKSKTPEAVLIIDKTTPQTLSARLDALLNALQQ